MGKPVAHCDIRITNPGGTVLSPGQVGSVEISGANVTRGYYGEHGAEPGENRRWLDTGDVGFFKDDSLYITGRLKDILFINGQNHYAHDLEDIACRIDGIDPGKVAVCAVNDSDGKSETIAVFVLHFGNLEEFAPVATQVRKLIGEHAGVEVDIVIPVEEIPRTTSGKTKRFALRQAYDNGQYSAVVAELRADVAVATAGLADHSGLEETLLEICAGSLGDVNLQRHDNFFEIGMNSLKLVEIHELIDQHFPSQLEVSDIFDHPTLARLAAFLQSKQQSAPP